MRIFIRTLILLVFCLSISFSESFLNPKDAFKLDILENSKSVDVKITLGKDVYLYKDRISILLTSPNEKKLNKEITLPKGEVFHEDEVYWENLDIKIPLSLIEKYTNNSPYSLKISYQGCSKKGLCYQPMEAVFSSDGKNFTKQKEISGTDSIVNDLKNSNFLWILITFLGLGFLLSLTPCILPMIPILSSIIVSQSGEKMSTKRGFYLSFVYVLGMSLAYALAGVATGLFGSSLQASLQNPYVIIPFALLFIALALSMFGFYDITLPKSMQSMANEKSGKMRSKGDLGIFAMGALSALIVSPCVAAPLAGVLLYIVQTGDALLGGFALFFFGLGMGIPLLIIGASAGKLLPKPGIWMDRVKNIFGVILLGVAIVIISRIVPLHVSLLMWAILFIFCSIYLGALEPLVSTSGWAKFIKALGVVVLLYGIVLFVGSFSGGKGLFSPLNIQTSKQAIAPAQNDELTFTTVKNLHELNQIISTSKKPVMLDFWATWCVSCEEMEEHTFKDKGVKERLKNFTLLRADVTLNTDEDKNFLSNFNLFGPPGIIFFKDKKELKHLEVIGYKNPDEFLQILNQI